MEMTLTANNASTATPQDDELVHVVDDDENYRTGMALLLRASGYEVQVYHSAEHFISTYQPQRIECLVLDLRMPGMTGIELQYELAERLLRLPVIVVSAFAETPSVVQAVKNGAFDFLEKPVEEQALLQKVAKALRHDRERKHEKGNLCERFARLSPREREVLELLLAARTTQQAARLLNISPKTIEKHRVNIFAKLDVSSVPELINLVHEH